MGDKILRKYLTKDIICAYKSMINVDVSDYFNKQKEICLYRNEESHLEFFLPELGGGSNKFYSDLAKQKWYYAEKRWEHYKTIDYLKNFSSIIDIGCGYGAFLDLVHENFQNINIYGSEFNDAAYNSLIKNKKYHIYNVNDYGELKNKKFDVVTSFQVLEHVSRPLEVLEEMIEMLNNNGILVVGVPNNSGVLGSIENVERSFLNMPPHHLTRWNKETFKYIESSSKLKLIELFEEPIKKDEISNFIIDKMYSYMKSRLVLKFFLKFKMYKIVQFFIEDKIRNKYTGHSLLAIFQKVE